MARTVVSIERNMLTHVSPFSGNWYPAGAVELRSLLESKEQDSRVRRPSVLGGALGFVVPHAGPAYSGAVAWSAYRSLRETAPERIVLLAFPHHGHFEGVSAPDVEAILTPLGAVEIDSAWSGFPLAPEARVCDHSFEIQLPFLQLAAPHARITPLYVGSLSEEEREAAADALAALWEPGVAFVASSDFTHYGREFGFTPFPADRHTAERIEQLDFECIDAAGSLRSARFHDALSRTGATVCGTGPIALLIETLRRIDGRLWPATLDYQTSGEITGDFRHSVSYAALGYLPRNAFDLPEGDGELLLDCVGATLGRLRALGGRVPVPAVGGTKALDSWRAAFVTLRRGEELLGCIGVRESRSPLREEAAELALAAALDDGRFKPGVALSGALDIEISILTPFRRIRDASECRPGRHGLYLKLGANSGLLLPQVAAERGWGAEEFFDAVARKSRLAPHAWRDPKAALYVFEAQIFERTRAVE